MTDEIVSEAQRAAGGEDDSLKSIENLMGGFMSAASVDAVYQKPIKHGDILMIPASEVFSIFGAGLGFGKSIDKAQDSGSGGGGGGGGSVHSRPVAVIISTPEGVRVDPVFDLTKIAVTGMAIGVMIFGMIARLAGLRRRVDRIQNEMMKFD
jgi:uncharacterized spore protein YtfJ